MGSVVLSAVVTDEHGRSARHLRVTSPTPNGVVTISVGYFADELHDTAFTIEQAEVLWRLLGQALGRAG